MAEYSELDGRIKKIRCGNKGCMHNNSWVVCSSYLHIKDCPSYKKFLDDSFNPLDCSLEELSTELPVCPVHEVINAILELEV